MLKELLTNRTLWERPLFDLWSIPHFISGALIALIVRKKDINIWLGFFISLSVAVLWEIFENITNISDVEYLSNQFIDVILAQVGFFVIILLPKKHYRKGASALAYIFGGIFIIFIVLGWLAYRLYVSSI